MYTQINNLQHLTWKKTWQQTRQVLHRWVQILSVSYAIPQLLVLLNDAKVTYLASFAPLRMKQPVTVGRVRQGLQHFFWHVNIRAMWNPKSGKFEPQKWPVEDEYSPVRATQEEISATIGAPFKRASNNSSYLEVHHLKPIAEGGTDTLENLPMVLCPNCHKNPLLIKGLNRPPRLI